MDKIEAIKLSQKYVEQVRNKYNVEKAILFGSYAKGTNKVDSDIDLAIIIKHSVDLLETQIDLLNLRSDDDLMIEPHLFLLSDFQKNAPLSNEIKTYGIEIPNSAA